MSPWWGNYEFSVHQTLRWQIGPTTLWITRGGKEWRVSTTEKHPPLDNRLSIAEAAEEPFGDDVDSRRFALGGESCTIRLVPALPDRPLIVKAASPFFVPTLGEVILFVSSPLWLRVSAEGSGNELVDVALAQPSDTWFGPNTMTGELCYASRSSARLHLENLAVRPHRSISALRICNRAKSILKLEKLKVPVQHLGLLASKEGHLWTDALRFEREDDTEEAVVRLVDRPKQIVDAVQVAAPRIRMSAGVLLDAFSGLFGKLREK